MAFRMGLENTTGLTSWSTDGIPAAVSRERTSSSIRLFCCQYL